MITKDMTINEAVRMNPDSIRVFEKFGLHCIGCMAAMYENIEQGARVHGIDADELVTALNDTARV